MWVLGRQIGVWIRTLQGLVEVETQVTCGQGKGNCEEIEVSPSFFRITSRPLCFQMMVGGRELTTSHTITASSPSLNSCGVGAFLNMSFSGKWGGEWGRQWVLPQDPFPLEPHCLDLNPGKLLPIYTIVKEGVPLSTWSHMWSTAAGTRAAVEGGMSPLFSNQYVLSEGWIFYFVQKRFYKSSAFTKDSLPRGMMLMKGNALVWWIESTPILQREVTPVFSVSPTPAPTPSPTPSSLQQREFWRTEEEHT